MRYIPADLKSKIEQAYQTIHGNNDPKMSVVAQKVTKYLTGGSLLQARTIRTGNSLGPLDICIRREDENADPTEIVMAYIENGMAKVATLPYVHRPDENFVYRYDLGEAVDVACDFDGRWHRITSRAGIYFEKNTIWALVTFGEPYFVRVLPTTGRLLVHHGQTAPIEIVPSGVTHCSLLRGWKNTYLWNHDHGIICAYIRGGAVCYRTFAQQPPDQPAIWELERVFTQIPTPANHVALSRTNDYRVKILYEVAGQMGWLLTERNWATMAIPPHTVSAAVRDVAVDMIPITYSDVYERHTVSAGITDAEALYCPAIWPQVLSLSNPSTTDTTTINIACDMALHGNLIGLQSAFVVTDGLARNYAVSATAKGATDNIIRLTTANFEAASGNLTVAYTYATAPIFSQVQGGCLMELTSFSRSFTPLIAPPQGFSPHTVGLAVTDVTVDVIGVTYTNLHDRHTVGVALTDVTVVMIHVQDLPI